MSKWSYEIVRNFNRRGQLIDQDSIWNIIVEEGEHSQLYNSVFLYKQSDKDSIESRSSMANLSYDRWAQWIPIDIDKGDSSDEQVNKEFKEILLAIENFGLCSENYNLWYSGTGYHIDIHSGCFNIKPSKDYPFMIRGTIDNLIPGTDLAIYTTSGLIRMPFSKNNKKSLERPRYKIYLTREEAFSLSAQEIITIAEDPANLPDRRKLYLEEQEDKYGEGELTDYVLKETPKVRTYNNKVLEPFNVVSCVYRILSKGPQKGSRNNMVLRLASFCARAGLPSRFAKAVILDWNDNSLDEDIVIKNIEYTYAKGYRYGCNDEILQKYCSTRCVHYKSKDLELEYMSSDDMQKVLEERMAMNPAELGYIPLTKMLGLPETEDCDIMPGELVTIIGGTGVNKSGFVQNIILGLDFVNNVIKEEYQLPTVLFSPELSPWLTQRRHLQILADLPKEKIMSMSSVIKAYKEYGKQLDHIQVVAKEMWLHHIERAIMETNAKLIVVDYAELVGVKGSSNKITVRLQELYPRLSNLAVEKDIIIIVVSQVSRSENESVTINSGFGSGSIEKSSRKVITINGSADDYVRHIAMVKNQDGSIFNVTMENQASFRLLRVQSDYEIDLRNRQLDYEAKNKLQL